MPTLASPPYPTPVKGASLLLAFKPRGKAILIVGHGTLAASRAFTALESDGTVVIAGYNGIETACDEIQFRVRRQEVSWIDLPAYNPYEPKKWEEDISRLLRSVPDLMLVCITDTLLDSTPSNFHQIPGSLCSSTSEALPYRSRLESATIIARACQVQKIPVNVTDMPSLCDFTLPTTHRFPLIPPDGGITSPTPVSAGKRSSLQISIATNGKACRLAGRIRREIISTLPKNIGMAVENIAALRATATEEESRGTSVLLSSSETRPETDDDCELHGCGPINAPAKQGIPDVEDPGERLKRRMRWVAQVSEYWPLDRLASMSKDEMSALLQDTHSADPSYPIFQVDQGAQAQKKCSRRKVPGYTLPLLGNSIVETSGSYSSLTATPSTQHSTPPALSPSEAPAQSNSNTTPNIASRHSLTIQHPLKPQGRILLVGSGPGHPSLLTVAARKALLDVGTLILSDKLVPSQILDLIPKDKTIYIAKKYPGNAEDAQNELMIMAVEGARRGEVVVRLKQGDPFLYGRGGEEVLYFRSQGYEPLVIPGVSSALAGPLLANIPVTQRGVAESLVVCTGVGRKGKDVELPGYQRERSVCILMGVARLGQIVQALTEEQSARRQGNPYPTCTPIAIIERASCPDQRVISSTLKDIEQAFKRCGEQRPPAMMFVGWAALALGGEGNLDVVDDATNSNASNDTLLHKDLARVEGWLGSERYIVQEGLSDMWGFV